jgi:hypothetical protein
MRDADIGKYVKMKGAKAEAELSAYLPIEESIRQ